MPSFVSKETVDISEFDPAEVISDVTPRVITIRAKMNYAQDAAVKGAVMQIGPDGKQVEFNPGNSIVALLVQNIVRWRGGDLEGVPCTRENIEQLDPQDPFVARVADEIGVRNRRRETFDPNAPTTNGAAPSTANESRALLVNGTSNSS
jgi:hypothetical protein